jgi:hypothetical protein
MELRLDLASGAALRATRADYCGDGQTHTFDGTPILIMDRQGYAAGAIEEDSIASDESPVTPAPFFFEAAWHHKLGAICLSRLRWDSLPPGGFCPGTMPDPRIKNSGGVFCEDLVGPVSYLREFLASEGFGNADVFTSSQYNEKTLTTWTNGLETIATTDPWSTASKTLNHPPADGFAVDVGSDPRVAQVYVNPKPGMVPLRRYENTTTHVHRTTKDALLPPWELRAEEGYVYDSIGDVPVSARPFVVQLISYSNSTRTLYRLLRAGQSVPAGFTLVANEGYGLPPL